MGVVTDRYKIIQNEEAFAFTDSLLGEGVRYETAGSLMGGRKVWLLAHLPHEYIISGERISPYLVFSNTHDGFGAVRVALTPIRTVCSNTLNLALATAKRSWSMVHTGNIKDRLKETGDTLFLAGKYMERLGKEFESLRMKKFTDRQIMDYIEVLLPSEDGATPQQARNMARLRENFWENCVLKKQLPQPAGSELCDSVLAEYFKNATAQSVPLAGFDAKLGRRQNLTAHRLCLSER